MALIEDGGGKKAVLKQWKTPEVKSVDLQVPPMLLACTTTCPKIQCAVTCQCVNNPRQC
jgi:hypothetical protein